MHAVLRTAWLSGELMALQLVSTDAIITVLIAVSISLLCLTTLKPIATDECTRDAALARGRWAGFSTVQLCCYV